MGLFGRQASDAVAFLLVSRGIGRSDLDTSRRVRQQFAER